MLQKPIHKSKASKRMSERAIDTLVARCSRRNSTVEVWEADFKRKVRKSYHLRYAVLDEVRAYEKLVLLLSGIAEIRPAAVVAVDYDRNFIETEYVEGSTLAEKIRSEDMGIAVLREFSDPLLRMLESAYSKDVKFDTDASNFIVDEPKRVLVIIDPPCAEWPLSHFTAVVFFWGLLKNAIPQSYRLMRWLAFAKLWNQLCGRYCYRTHTKRSIFDRQMSAHIGQVIKWNLNESDREKLAKRITRRVIVAPCWWLIKMGFEASARVRERYS